MSRKYPVDRFHLTNSSGSGKCLDDSSSDEKCSIINMQESEDTDSEENVNSQLLQYKQLVDSVDISKDISSVQTTEIDKSCTFSVCTENFHKPSSSVSSRALGNFSTASTSARSVKNFSSGCASLYEDSSVLKKESFAEYGDIRDFGDKEKYIYREDERIAQAVVKENVCCLPNKISQTYKAHSANITSLNWCINNYSYLFLSSSTDGSVKIWDLYRKSAVHCIINSHPLKAAEWSCDGKYIVSGGCEEKANVYDVHSGKRILSYDICNCVFSLKYHPYRNSLFLCGTRNAIFGFDMRMNSSFPVRTFISKCEDVLDIAFLDENDFVCSTSSSNYDSSDRNIMVWDFTNGASLSNQIYMERQTCQSLKVHPTLPVFAAQTSGEYIALFSSFPPYKMKMKFRSHKVLRHFIECDFSPDGKYLASGDACSRVFFYSYANPRIIYEATVESNGAVHERPNDEDSKTGTVKSDVLKQSKTKGKMEFKASVRLKVPEEKKEEQCVVAKSMIAINKIKWHPVFPSTIMTSSWNGYIQVWK